MMVTIGSGPLTGKSKEVPVEHTGMAQEKPIAPEAEVEVKIEGHLSPEDLSILKKLGVLSVQSRGDAGSITKCSVDLASLAEMANELDLLERRHGSRWTRGGWSPR